jgi:hypothetical protein
MATSAEESSSPLSQEEKEDPAATETFGERLAAAIEVRGWTLAEAAREISRYLPGEQVFNPVNLSHYVHGRSFPRPKYRKAWSRPSISASCSIRPGRGANGRRTS